MKHIMNEFSDLLTVEPKFKISFLVAFAKLLYTLEGFIFAFSVLSVDYQHLFCKSKL